MRILHVLDHSIPLHSGYTFRTLSILQEQRALGWETVHLTSSKQGPCASVKETIDGWEFYRTPNGSPVLEKMPLLKQLAIINNLATRLLEVARQVKPDVLHAHSPALNAIAALRVGRKLGIPVVYEIRAFWEDAAVDHGTSREWGIRYRLTRALETLRHKARRCRHDHLRRIAQRYRATGDSCRKNNRHPQCRQCRKFQRQRHCQTPHWYEKPRTGKQTDTWIHRIILCL